MIRTGTEVTEGGRRSANSPKNMKRFPIRPCPAARQLKRQLPALCRKEIVSGPSARREDPIANHSFLWRNWELEFAAEPDFKSFSPAAAKSASHDAARAPNETSATGLLLTAPAPDGPVPGSVFHSELRTARSTDPWPRSEVRFQPPLSPLPCLEDEFALAPVVLPGSSPFP